jgi:hypothetical protein
VEELIDSGGLEKGQVILVYAEEDERFNTAAAP